MAVNITGGSGSGSGIKGTALKIGTGIGIGALIGWGVSSGLQEHPSEAGGQPETYGTLFFGPEKTVDKNLSDGHEKLYIAEKGGDVSIIETAVFEPIWTETNLTAMDAKYNGSSFMDKLKENGAIESWNISYELDNASHAMTLTAKKGNITYKSDGIPFEELRGKDGKLAKIGGVSEIRILPRALLQDEPFELKVPKNIITQELYTNAKITNELNGTYEKAQLAMPDSWMDDKVIAEVKFLEKTNNTKANRTGELNITGIAEFFDQMDNGKMDKSADDFVKDYVSTMYGVHEKTLAVQYEQMFRDTHDMLLSANETIKETRKMLEDMKTISGNANASYQKIIDRYENILLPIERMKLTNMTTNYTTMLQNWKDKFSELNATTQALQDAEKVIGGLKDSWNAVNATLEQFNKTYMRTTEGDKHTAGRVFYNMMTAQERGDMLTALGIDRATWDKMFDDNATGPSPEIRKIEVMIPGLGETAKVNITTSAGKLTGEEARAYAVNLEQKILGNKDGMIDYTGAGEMPAYLAKLSGPALKAEIDKLKGTEGYWGAELKYDSKNNSKFASLANVIDGLYGQVGDDWNTGNYSLGFLDTQDSGGMGGIVYVHNGTEMKAYTLTKENIKKAKEIVG